jgi:hypothetical protein
VTVEYEDGNNNITSTKRAIRVRPALDLTEEATADPSLPSVSITKGQGETSLAIGEPVSPSNVVASGPVFADGGPVWAEGRAEALARRLGVDGLEADDPQLSLLQQAGSLLVSALAHPTESGLMEYTLDLPSGADPGQVLIFDGGTLRLEETSGGGWTAIGHLEDSADTSSAHLTGNGGVFTVEAELAYGQAGNADFPIEAHARYRHVRPDETQTTISLPQATPEAAGDRWHIRYRVQSEWPGGASVTGEWSSWEPAEKLPSSPASLSLEDDSMLAIEAPGTAHGLVDWSASGESPIDNSDVPGAEPLPSRMPAPVPNKYWNGPNNPPQLYAKLLQTAPAGSSRDQIEQFSLSYAEASTDAVPQASVEGNAIPQDWNVVPGMMISGDTQTWIGSPNGYVSLGTGGQMVDKIELFYGGTLYEAQKNGPTEFLQPVPFFNISELEVRLHAIGPVEDVTLFDNDYTLFRRRSATPAFDENGGYYKQTLTVPPTAHGLDDDLLYQFSAGTDEQLVRLKLENSSISQTDGPDVLTLDALLQNNPEISQSIDRSVNPETWTLTLEEDVSWQGAYLTLTAESLEDGQILSVTDGNDTAISDPDLDFTTQTDTTPQRIFLDLADSAFASKDVTISLELSGNGNTTNVNLQLNQYTSS